MKTLKKIMKISLLNIMLLSAANGSLCDDALTACDSALNQAEVVIDAQERGIQLRDLKITRLEQFNGLLETRVVEMKDDKDFYKTLSWLAAAIGLGAGFYIHKAATK